MLDANDETYFNVSGMLIYDPVISGGSAGIAPTNYFVNYWRNVSYKHTWPNLFHCAWGLWHSVAQFSRNDTQMSSSSDTSGCRKPP